jgi:hypothetical protein
MLKYHDLLVLLACGVLGFGQVLPNDAIALVMAFVATRRFILQLDERPVLLESAALIALVQLVIAPLLMYRFLENEGRYRMYVEESQYFSLAIPGVVLYMVGLFSNIPYKTPRPAPTQNAVFDERTGMLFIFGGVAVSLLAGYLPGDLGFLFYILSQFRYIGAIYLYQSKSPLRIPLIALALSGTMATAARYGMFHELLLWFGMLGSYWFIVKRRPISHKIAYAAIAVLLVILIQDIKAKYREYENTGSLSGFFSFMSTHDLFEDTETTNLFDSTVIRLNQGWLVSRLQYNVPANIDFAEGSTIKEALYSALVPRILDRAKATASGRDNLNRYSGLNLKEGTSMGMSPLGEGYVNFGGAGGMAFMFLFGLLLNFLYRTFAGWSYSNYFFLYAMPIVFLQAIKAETESLTVFNHLSKSMIVIIAIYYFFIRQFPSIFRPVKQPKTASAPR